MDSVMSNPPAPPGATEETPLQKLQAHYDALSALSQRLSAVRRAPAVLLTPPPAKSRLDMSLSLPGVFAVPAPAGTALRAQLAHIRELVQVVAREDVQAALKEAGERYKADTSGVHSRRRLGAEYASVLALAAHD
jgi:hypothetical protein